jgi:thiol-disulfide isomerase/thioredoxin
MFAKHYLPKLLLILMLLQNVFFLKSQSVSIRCFNFRGQEIVFGYQYGNDILRKSTARLDDNGFTYIYNQSLHSGIYNIIFPDSTIVEFMYDSAFPGNVKIEKKSTGERAIIDGSVVTREFDSYKEQLAEQTNKNKAALKKNLHPTFQNYHTDSLLLSFANKAPESLLESYLKVQLSIKIPDYNPPAETNNKDSAIWVHNLIYYSKHFFDNFDFTDSRLLNTPLYTNMTDYFLDIISPKDVSGLNQNIDNLMQRTAVNPVYQQFTAKYLLKKYARKRINPVFEAVYTHIVEKYYLKSGFNWISNDELYYLTKEYNRRKPSLIGEPAPNISMNGIENDTLTLYNLNHKLILIYFYNYDCPICEKVTPELRKLVSRYDYLDIGVYAVCIGENPELWKRYVAGNKISHWSNVCDNNRINDVALTYNLGYTPTLFLLDKQKTILDKNFTLDELSKTLFSIATKEKK